MVAGGAGFVGSAVVRELLARGARVVCFDNYLHGVPENVQSLDGSLAVVQGDVLDEFKLMHCISAHGVDHVINCIGDTFVPTAYDMPRRFFEINVRGTANILMAAKLARLKRVLYLSSTEVYGDVPGGVLTERSPLNPVNTYAVSKLAADRLCHTFHLEHGVPVVIARLFNCYGPRATKPYIVPEIIAQLSRSNVLQLGNLTAQRDLTYVHDTARALVAVLESDIPDGEAVNVGSDTAYTVEGLAGSIAAAMDIRDYDVRLDESRLRRREIQSFRCDYSRLREATGWTPQVPIEEGLRRTVDWFRANGSHWSWETFVRNGSPLR